VIPLSCRLAKSLSRWLFVGDEATFELRPDLDNLDALAPDREALWARLDGAGFLSRDEKRAAAGYGPAGDSSAKFNPYHDEAGRRSWQWARSVGRISEAQSAEHPSLVQLQSRTVAPASADYGAKGAPNPPYLSHVLYRRRQRCLRMSYRDPTTRGPATRCPVAGDYQNEDQHQHV
jgi:hypothetical protein